MLNLSVDPSPGDPGVDVGLPVGTILGPVTVWSVVDGSGLSNTVKAVGVVPQPQLVRVLESPGDVTP